MEALRLLEQLDAILEADETKEESVKIRFAEEVARAMKRKTISRSELAQNMSVSLPYISKLLKGDANLSLKSIVKVCSALGGELHLSISDPNHRLRNSDWAAMVENRSAKKVVTRNANWAEKEGLNYASAQ